MILPSPYPDDNRATAFRWFADRLRAKVRGVAVWQVWDGSRADTAPLPTGKTAVRLTPQFEATRPAAILQDGADVRANRRSWRAPILVQVEGVVPGSRAEDAINLWGQIESAMTARTFADRVTLRTHMRECKVNSVEPVQPFAMAQDGNVSRFSGSFRLITHIVV